MAAPDFLGTNATWCGSGPELVALLCDAFGKENVLVRSPYHLQVRSRGKPHDVWIGSARVVKFKLAGEAGRAEVARSAEKLLAAIRGYQFADSDLADMRRALELSELIDSAKARLPTTGLAQAVFVDAGIKNGESRIGVVRIALKADGEHVRAESRPTVARNSTDAELAAIEFALSWAEPEDTIFCDNQSAVNRARRVHGDHIRWLPRELNKAADRVANLRGKTNRKRRKRKGKKRKPSNATPRLKNHSENH